MLETCKIAGISIVYKKDGTVAYVRIQTNTQEMVVVSSIPNPEFISASEINTAIEESQKDGESQ